MRKKSYLPSTDHDKVVWLNNFATKFTVLSPSLGFVAADITSVNNDAAMFAYLITLVETFTTEKEERVNYKNLIRSGPIGTVGVFPTMPAISAAPVSVPAGVFLRIANIVQRIKAHTNYTEAIGRDLGIIGAEQTLDIAAMKPVLKLQTSGWHIEVQWVKDHADAIRIEVNRGAGWQFLAIDTMPNYTDSSITENHITLQYRAMYIIHDELVGQWSDVASITI